MSKKIIYAIHGMWASGADPYWQNYKQFFQPKDYSFYTPTLPYHGPVSQPDKKLGTMRLKDYIDFLQTDMAALPEKPIIIGHSMGGWLALKLTELGLARLTVLITPATPAGIFNTTPSVIRCFLPSLARPFFWKRPFKASFRTFQYGILNEIKDIDLQKKIYSEAGYESGKAAFELGFWPIDCSYASKIDYSRIHSSILLIAGGKDRITPAHGIEQLSHKIPSADYHFYQSHAHGIMWEEKWHNVVKNIEDWLKNRWAV